MSLKLIDDYVHEKTEGRIMEYVIFLVLKGKKFLKILLQSLQSNKNVWKLTNITLLSLFQVFTLYYIYIYNLTITQSAKNEE